MKRTHLDFKLLVTLFFIFSSLSLYACNPLSGLEVQNLKMLHEKSFETSPGKKLTVQAYSGDVYITTNHDSKVNIKVFGNEKAEDKLKFSFNNTDEGVLVKAEKESGWNFLNFGNGIRLKFEISIPENYNVSASSSGGDINLTTLKGEAKLKSSGGDIWVKQITGNLFVTTSGGDIKVDKNIGTLELSTSGGEITCRDFNGNTNAHSSGGDLQLSGSNGKVAATTSGGDITLKYNGENKGIKLKSSGGDIRVRIPSDFNASANMYTSGGDIQCSLPNTNAKRISSTRFEADINKGGNNLNIRTSGGDITVKEN